MFSLVSATIQAAILFSIYGEKIRPIKIEAAGYTVVVLVRNSFAGEYPFSECKNYVAYRAQGSKRNKKAITPFHVLSNYNVNAASVTVAQGKWSLIRNISLIIDRSFRFRLMYGWTLLFFFRTHFLVKSILTSIDVEKRDRRR